MNEILYFNGEFDTPSDPNSKIIRIKKHINDKSELFDIFSSQLEFPSYFGKNWDALTDCLSDLHWVKETNIFIFHEDIPLGLLKDQQRIYIETLYDTIDIWRNDKSRVIKIYFPESSRDEINAFRRMQS